MQSFLNCKIVKKPRRRFNVSFKEEVVEVDEGPEVIEEGSEGTEKSGATRKALRRIVRELDKPTTPAQAYELELRDWLKLY